VHKLAGTGVAVAGLTAALLLTGCGGSGGGSSGTDKAASGDKSDSAAATPAATSGGSATPGAPDADLAQAAKRLEGAWAGLTDGKSVTLLVKEGKAALVADQHVCSGSLQDMGQPMLSLTCADGNTERTMGTIRSNDGKTLLLSWGAGKKDRLMKADAADAPPGLPKP
jgi:hypothetical protein